MGRDRRAFALLQAAGHPGPPIWIVPSHAPELPMLRWLPQGIGARWVRLELRRVDGGTAPVEIGRCLRKAKG